MKQFQNQVAETPILAFPPSLLTEPCALSSNVRPCSQPSEDARDVEGTISSANTLRQQIPLSGVVDAILEIGDQRKAILGRLRSALVGGNDSEALGFARQLCGLTI